MPLQLHSKILGRGFPLLILHGFLGSGDNWITLGRRFSENFKVHILDLRNHGRSFHDDDMCFEVMCQDVLHYCEFVGLKEIYILGHSMGGKIAMHLAVHKPDLVKKLIVADIAPRAYKRGHDFLIEALEAVDFPKQKTRNDVENVIAKYIDSKPIRQFLLKNVYRKSANELAYRFNLPVLVENYDSLIETLPTYSQYEGETLFLKGENSDYILKSDIPLIEAHFTRAQIVTISNAGHWLHAENPIMFFEEIMTFLNKT